MPPTPGAPLKLTVHRNTTNGQHRTVTFTTTDGTATLHLSYPHWRHLGHADTLLLAAIPHDW
jgi:hypothetical protein